MSISIRPFQPSTDTLKPFDCGKADLNGFLCETGTAAPNAAMYEREHLAKTYIVEDADTHIILAYFSLSKECPPEAKTKDLFSPHKMPVIRAPRPDRIGRTLFLPFHLL